MKEKLMEIHGIGEAKAEEIMDVVNKNSSNEHVEQAIGYLENGNIPQALEHLKKV